MFRSILNSVFLVLLALMTPFAAGCSDAQPAPEGDTTGTFTASLVTQGADGATYAFPTGTFINLRIQDNSFNDFFALDNPNETLVTRRVPSGSYTASLTYNGVEGAYVLQKTQNGQVSIVPATLLNPTPIQFDVAAGGTTSLALSFRVQGVGDITFNVGNVNITLNVSEQVNATGSQMRLVEGGIIQNANLDPSLSAQAQALLAVSPGEMFSYSLAFQLTGPWHLSGPTSVCANGTIVSLTASGTAGFAARMSQVVGAGGQACVFDIPGNDQVSIGALTFTTPSDQVAALPGSYMFNFFADGYGGDVFNGTTFQQSLFEGPRAHGFGTFHHSITDQSTGTVVGLMENISNMNLTIQILP
jgi:hypothetical protein